MLLGSVFYLAKNSYMKSRIFPMLRRWFNVQARITEKTYHTKILTFWVISNVPADEYSHKSPILAQSGYFLNRYNQNQESIYKRLDISVLCFAGRSRIFYAKAPSSESTIKALGKNRFSQWKSASRERITSNLMILVFTSVLYQKDLS